VNWNGRSPLADEASPDSEAHVPGDPWAYTEMPQKCNRVSRVRHRPGGRSNAPDLVPRMIRMALQNRERPVNLLQQNHSRQFMRQRHPPE
jgi:hypothetical protein